MATGRSRDHGLMRLPDVLSPIDLPLAELMAARLDGEFFALDESFLPIDQLDDRRHRALAIAPLAAGRLIAEQHTAAWIYGALLSPPSRHEFCTAPGGRLSGRGNRQRMRVREVVIDAIDVVAIGGVPVTAPARTVVDLVRFVPEFGAGEAALIRDLMALTEVTAAECLEVMERKRNLPGKHRALARLSRALAEKRIGSASTHAIDVVNRVDPAHGVENAVEVGRVPHLKHEATESKAIA